MAVALVCKKMELGKLYNGYCTVTFIPKNNEDEQKIIELFSSAGEICRVSFCGNRAFVRYKEKEEAEKAISIFGELYNVTMARNSKKMFSFNQQSEPLASRNKKNYRNSQASPDKPSYSSGTDMNKLNSGFHLVLGNLPKNYTMRDVNNLVEEAKPVSVSEIEESKACHLKLCHIVLESNENLLYLIEKLNGFVICGEKLIAIEAKKLLEWKEMGL